MGVTRPTAGLENWGGGGGGGGVTYLIKKKKKIGRREILLQTTKFYLKSEEKGRDQRVLQEAVELFQPIKSGISLG